MCDFYNRWWWSPADLGDYKSKLYNSINFLWTSWKHNDFINTLKHHMSDDNTKISRCRSKSSSQIKIEASFNQGSRELNPLKGIEVSESQTSPNSPRIEKKEPPFFRLNSSTDKKKNDNLRTGDYWNHFNQTRKATHYPKETNANGTANANSNCSQELSITSTIKSCNFLNLGSIQNIMTNREIANYIHYENYCKKINWTDNNHVKLAAYFDSIKPTTDNNTKFSFKHCVDPNINRICNHLENNFLLSNKKALYYNTKNYYKNMKLDPFDYIPLTFHIQHYFKDPEYEKFLEHYNKLHNDGCNNIWIIKPGENTNRGTGITVTNELNEINAILSEKIIYKNGKCKTYIIQKYIEKPLLYNKRKFDIRCYILITSINGIQKGYWYQDGYIRTSSTEYSLSNLSNRMIHLTNDAVQKNSDDYGKFESGNKVITVYFILYINL